MNNDIRGRGPRIFSKMNLDRGNIEYLKKTKQIVSKGNSVKQSGGDNSGIRTSIYLCMRFRGSKVTLSGLHQVRTIKKQLGEKRKVGIWYLETSVSWQTEDRYISHRNGVGG